MTDARDKWIEKELPKVARHVPQRYGFSIESIAIAAWDAGVKHALEHVASLYKTRGNEQAREMRGTDEVLTSWGFLGQEVRRMKP